MFIRIFSYRFDCYFAIVLFLAVATGCNSDQSNNNQVVNANKVESTAHVTSEQKTFKSTSNVSKPAPPNSVAKEIQSPNKQYIAYQLTVDSVGVQVNDGSEDAVTYYPRSKVVVYDTTSDFANEFDQTLSDNKGTIAIKWLDNEQLLMANSSTFDISNFTVYHAANNSVTPVKYQTGAKLQLLPTLTQGKLQFQLNDEGEIVDFEQ